MADKKIKTELDWQYRLLGIATPLKEYRLCYHLNQLLDCDFRKLKDITIEPKERKPAVSFGVLVAGEEDDKNRWMVFTNKNAGEFLLPEAANFDYVLMITGRYDDEAMHGLTEAIRVVSQIMLCVEVPLKKVKNKGRLVVEEERPVRKLMSIKKNG